MDEVETETGANVNYENISYLDSKAMRGTLHHVYMHIVV